jgi:hypothetical protein
VDIALPRGGVVCLGDGVCCRLAGFHPDDGCKWQALLATSRRGRRCTTT